ncbi:hypothetical protein LTR86_000758 [Recurvomyces mirabilis]|nr:hypothetical protein LTR86_000758 [Recurvomyces mirabilis]
MVDPADYSDPKTPVYTVASGAGNIEGLLSMGANMTGNLLAYADDMSYGQLKIIGAQHLSIAFIRSSTSEVLDSSVLIKSHSQAFVVQA